MAGQLEVAGRGRPLFQAADGPNRGRKGRRYVVSRSASSTLEPLRQAVLFYFAAINVQVRQCSTVVCLNDQLSSIKLAV
jgi:hypothetical protein